MHVTFDILRNFTAIIMLVLGFRFMAWAGLCGRAWINGGNPALEAITHRRVDVVEHEIFAGAFLLCTMAFGALLQPGGYHFRLPIEPSMTGWVVLVGSIALMLCWRLMHPSMKIGHPWRVVGSAAAMAIVLGVSKWGL